MAFRDNFGNPQGFIGRLMLSGMNKAHFVDKLNAGFNPDIIFIQPQNSLQHTE